MASAHAPQGPQSAQSSPLVQLICTLSNTHTVHIMHVWLGWQSPPGVFWREDQAGMDAAPRLSSVRPPRSGTLPISTDLALAAGRAVSGVDTGPMISTKSSAGSTKVSTALC